LLRVRYCYDDERHLRHTTVKLVVETVPLQPQSPTASLMVGVRVGLREVELQRPVKQAGGKWSHERRLWEVRYDQAVALGSKARIEDPHLPNTRKVAVCIIHVRQPRPYP
jgi:hypothetical protein